MTAMLRFLLPLTLAAGAFFLARNTAHEAVAPGWQESARQPGTPAVPQAKEKEDFAIRFERDPVAAMSFLRNVPQKEWPFAAGEFVKILLRGDARLTALLLPYLDELMTERTHLPLEPGIAPQAAAAILALPPGKAREILLRKLCGSWLHEDWQAATTWAGAQAPPLREQLLADMATMVFRGSGPSGACPWAESWLKTDATPQQRQALGGYYADQLAANNPSSAMEWAQANLAGRPLAAAIARVLQLQAASDPAAARSLVEQLPPGGARSRAALAIVEKQPDEASVSWLLTQVKRDDEGWYRTARQWAERDPPAYRKFLATTEMESIPIHMIYSGLDVLSRKNALGTLEWALGTGRETYIDSSMEKFSTDDPGAAANWLTEHPGADVSNGAVWVVADRNFRHNPTTAATWAAQLPEGPWREAAVSALQDSIEKAGNLPPVEKSKLRGVLQPE